jgi:phage shock protein A
MNIWASMISALKGGEESSDALLDTKAIRILDKEILSASQELKASKDALTELIAQQKQSENVIAEQRSSISEHESYAIQALDQQDEALALEVAEKIVEIETDIQHQQDITDGYSSSIKSLQHVIKQAELNLKRLKQQVDTIKATDSVQRAQASIASRHLGNGRRLQTAQDSLARLKERQADKAARFDAEQQSAETSAKDELLEKLADAGITSGSTKANDVLARLKRK